MVTTVVRQGTQKSERLYFKYTQVFLVRTHFGSLFKYLAQGPCAGKLQLKQVTSDVKSLMVHVPTVALKKQGPAKIHPVGSAAPTLSTSMAGKGGKLVAGDPYLGEKCADYAAPVFPYVDP